MISDFLDSFNKTNLAELSLPELVRIDDILTYYENTTDLSAQRKRMNQELEKRARGDDGFRGKIHEIKTGYKEENWRGHGLSADRLAKYKKREQYGWNPNFAWKFHLDVVPNRNHPVTRAISDFLIDLCVTHKIASGGYNGKGMTVYVGSYDDICKLAHVIQEKFGSKISKPPFYTNQVAEEHEFEPTVYGRFCVEHYGDYPMDNIGISPIANLGNVPALLESIKIAKQKANELGIVKEGSGRHPNGFFDKLGFMWSGQNRDEAVLTIYCSHKLYVVVFGQYYCGKYLRAFENKFFGDKIPALGTPERQKWDVVADTFVQEAQKRNVFEKFRSKARGYVPLDLSRLNQENEKVFEYMQNNNARK